MARNYDMKNVPDLKNSTKVMMIAGFIIVILGIYVLSKSYYIVESGQVGVITHFGNVQDEILPEGLHMIHPVKTKIVPINTRIQKVEANATASSKDLQNVTSKVALNFYLSKEKANEIYQKIGLNYLQTIIQPAIQESVKSSTAQFTAEELITKRPKVKMSIFTDLKERLKLHEIIVSDFSIIDFNFSREFNKAIEEKQVAEQRALRAKNDLNRIQVEAEQARVKAEGLAKAELEMAKAKADAMIVLAKAEALAKLEVAKAEAEAQKLLRETLTSDVLHLRSIEKWNGILPTIMGEKTGGMFFDVTNSVNTKSKSR